MTVGRQPTGTIEIGGKLYYVAKGDAGRPLYSPRNFPTQEGDPTLPRRERWNDWSRGMGDSRGAFVGAVEYAEAYLGAPGRMLPPPKINIIDVTHELPITCFAVVTAPANRVISFGGQYAYEINPSTHASADTIDLGAGKTPLDVCLFIDQVAIALGDAVLFKRRSAAGAYSDNTLTGDRRYARAFGLSVTADGITGLVRGRANKWSKATAADFYGTDGNWSTESDVGDPSGNINQVGSFQRADYVLKDDGLYSFFSENSAASNVLPALEAFHSTENKRWFTKDNRLFICSYAGLYRLFHNGPARTVGIEEAEFNESALANVYPTAGIAFGKWQWVAYYDAVADHTYICMEREARDGDATFGSPSTVICVIDDFDGECRAMVVPTKVTGTPELWYARDLDIAWVKLSRSGLPVEFATGTTTRVAHSPNDFGAPMTMKYFRGVEIIGRNFAAGRALTIKAAMDEGAENAVGAALTSLTNGFGSRFWTAGSNDSGRKMQLIAELTNDDDTDPVEVREMIVSFEEKPLQVPGFAAVLQMRDFDQQDDAETRATALEAREALEAHLDGAPTTIIDMDGNEYTGAVFSLEGETDYQFTGRPPQGSVSVGVRSLAYS